MLRYTHIVCHVFTHRQYGKYRFLSEFKFLGSPTLVLVCKFLCLVTCIVTRNVNVFYTCSDCLSRFLLSVRPELIFKLHNDLLYRHE